MVSKCVLESALGVPGILSPQQVRRDNLSSVHGSLMEGTSTNPALSLVAFIPLLPGTVPSSGSLESPPPQAGVLSRGESQGTAQSKQSRSWGCSARRSLRRRSQAATMRLHKLSGEGQIKLENDVKHFWELISPPVPKGGLQEGRRGTFHRGMW